MQLLPFQFFFAGAGDIFSPCHSALQYKQCCTVLWEPKPEPLGAAPNRAQVSSLLELSNQKQFFMQYGISQLSKLEDSINERWAWKKSENTNISKFSF